MALSAAEMVTLIREEIEARITGVRKGSSDGEAWEQYGLEELRDLEKSYQAEAQADSAADTGGLSLSTILRSSLNVDSDSDD